jgi:hypothetical protein
VWLRSKPYGQIPGFVINTVNFAIAWSAVLAGKVIMRPARHAGDDPMAIT